MPQGPPRRRRARPVADAPIDVLLMRAEDLTKGWLLALLEQAPLDDAPAILAGDLARDGPRLCAAVVRALADEEDLRRLEPGGALEPLASRIGEIAGSPGVQATARAVDALAAVLWSALRDELRGPEADLVAELAERLTLVMELVRSATLRHPAGQAPPQPVEATSGAPALARLRTVERAGPVAGPAVGSDPTVAPEPPPSAGAARGVPPAESPVPAPPAAAPAPPAAASAPPAAASAPSAPAASALAASAPAPPGGEPLWKGALADEIRRAERSGAALSLVLIELDDADRVLSAASTEEASATFGRFAQAVRSAVRRQDILACETEARAWVVARDTGRSGAHALGRRMTSAVQAAPAWRGAPLRVSIGFAVFGEDAREAEGLIEAAEEDFFAAAASGVGVTPGGSEEPREPTPGGET